MLSLTLSPTSLSECRASLSANNNLPRSRGERSQGFRKRSHEPLSYAQCQTSG